MGGVLAFFSFFGVLAFGLAAFFLVAPSFFAGFLAFVAFFAFGFLAGFSAFLAAESLKLPLAPFPLVCTNTPLATAFLRHFLMNGANFSTSTLQLAAMYFLMAWRDEPPLSFRVLMAAFTIVAVGGWFGVVFGFLAFAAFLGLAATSVILRISVILLRVKYLFYIKSPC